MGKLKVSNEFMANKKYQAIRKDMDTNAHMHNLYYLDLAYEALPKEVYENVCFDDVACVCPNEFSRIEFRESIGESEGRGENGVY